MFGRVSQPLALSQSFYCLVSRLPLPITVTAEAPAMHSDSAINALHQCCGQWPTTCSPLPPSAPGFVWRELSSEPGDAHQEALLPQKGAKCCRWWMWYGCLRRKGGKKRYITVLLSACLIFLADSSWKCTVLQNDVLKSDILDNAKMIVTDEKSSCHISSCAIRKWRKGGISTNAFVQSSYFKLTDLEGVNYSVPDVNPS